MSLTRPGRNNSPLGNPAVFDYDVAASMSINAGDWVVLASVTSNVRVRKLTTTDIGNHYAIAGPIYCGVLGIAMNSCYTDANGYATVNATSSTIAGGAYPLFPLPTYSSGLDNDPNQSGVARIGVAVTSGGSSFIMRAQTSANAAVTVTLNTISQSTGIQIYNTGDFAWNFGATTVDIVGLVSGVLEQDPAFNVSSTQCLVECRILAAYAQYQNGNLYGT